jgi:hypothetical protein
MLTGDFVGELTLTQVNIIQAVVSIKAIRTVSGYGLKESKDLFDHLRDTGHGHGRAKIKLSEEWRKNRSGAIRVLRDAGCDAR